MFRNPGILIVLACLPACLLADFSYDQSTKITGGMMAGVMKFAGAFSKQAREAPQSPGGVKGELMVQREQGTCVGDRPRQRDDYRNQLSEEDLQRHDVRGDEAGHGTGHAARQGRTE